MNELTLQRGDCRSCTGPIAWVSLASTGRRMPVDVDAVDAGNVEVRPDGRGGYLATILRAGAHAVIGAHLFRRHVETCTGAPK